MVNMEIKQLQINCEHGGSGGKFPGKGFMPAPRSTITKNCYSQLQTLKAGLN